MVRVDKRRLSVMSNKMHILKDTPWYCTATNSHKLVKSYGIWFCCRYYAEIVGNVSRGQSHAVWMSILGFLSLIYLGLFAGSIGQSQTEQETFDTPYKLRNMLFGREQ